MMGLFGKLFDKKECSVCGGEIELRGKVRIQGSLTVNGEPYAPCES